MSALSASPAFTKNLVYATSTKIECLAYFQCLVHGTLDRYVVLGTTDGHIQFIRVRESGGEGEMAGEIQANSLGKPITQISVIRELSLLAVLTCKQITVYRIMVSGSISLEEMCKLAPPGEEPAFVHFASYSAFAANPSDPTGETSVAKVVLLAFSKNHWFYYGWDTSQQEFRFAKRGDFPTDTGEIREVHLFRQYMMYCVKKGWIMQVQNNFHPVTGSSLPPLTAQTTASIVNSTGPGSIDVVVSGGPSVQYLKINVPKAGTPASPTDKSRKMSTISATAETLAAIPTEEPPVAVFPGMPFVLALTPKGASILLFGNSITTMFQQIPGKFLCAANAPCMNELFTYSGMLGSPVLANTVISSKLTKNGALNNMFVLCGPGATQNEIFLLQPVPLDQQKRVLVNIHMDSTSDISFRAALELSLHAEAAGPKMQHEINAMWGYFLFQQGPMSYGEAMKKFLASRCDPRCVLRLFKGVIKDGAGMQAAARENHPPTSELNIIDPATNPEGYKKGLTDLSDYIFQWRTLQQNDRRDENHEHFGEVESDEVHNQLLRTVDTALLKVLVLNKQDQKRLITYLTMPNHCDLNESVTLLNTPENYGALVTLYKVNGKHDEALKVLTQRGQFYEAIAYLVEIGAGPKNRAQIAKSGAGVGDDVHIRPHDTTLRDTGYYQSVHRKYAKLILKTLIASNEDESLKIYTAPVPDNIEPIDRRIGLEILKKVGAPRGAIIKMLEHAIATPEDGGMHPDLHNTLAEMYLLEIAELTKDWPADDPEPGAAMPIDPMSGIYPQSAAPRGGTEPGKLGELRRQLLAFLKSSEKYDANFIYRRCVELFPEGLLEEKSILNFRRGEYIIALRALAIDLGNAPLAEMECASQYSADDMNRSRVYLSLLNVYVDPFPGVPGAVPFMSKAIDTLRRHWRKIPPVEAIGLMSGFQETTVADLEDWLRSAFCDMSSRLRALQAKQAILESRLLNLKEHNSFLSNIYLTVDRTTNCAACGEPITSAQITIFPNGQVIHRGCEKHKNIMIIMQESKKGRFQEMLAEPFLNMGY